MKTKDINYWTKKEFEALPEREWNEDIGEFDALIILPTNYTHDSGYKCMDFIAEKNGKPFCRLSGCSDIIHINGIGGYGDDWLQRYKGVPKKIEPLAWSIDCLKTSKLLRIFVGAHKLKAGAALSSFELFAIKKIEP